MTPTPKQINSMTGPELSEACAKMMDIKMTKYSRVLSTPVYPFMLLGTLWKPHATYDQCRMVEDWIFENGRQGTCADRLRAALLAYYVESKFAVKPKRKNK